MEEELIKSISHVKNSKYRFNVLKILSENELLTPREIADKVQLRLNHVSMTLSELKSGNLVECVNEESKRGRLYQITALGRKTSSWIKEHS